MPNIQKSRTLQTATTSLTGAQVLATAKTFFGRQNGIYAAFVEQEGPTHVTLRGQGGEEIVVGVASGGGGTSVNASSYMFDQQVAMFLSALPPAASTGTV
jgi:hypothetical protein